MPPAQPGTASPRSHPSSTSATSASSPPASQASPTGTWDAVWQAAAYLVTDQAAAIFSLAGSSTARLYLDTADLAEWAGRVRNR